MCDAGEIKDNSLISDDELNIVRKVVHGGLCLAVVVVGLVTSIFNIVVFRRLDYRDSVNVTMTGIAACDIVKLTCALIFLMYWPIGLVSTPLAVTWEHCTFPQVVFLHLIFTNAAFVMAGFLAVERCLCVSLPMRVKHVLTPRITCVVLVVIVVIVFSTLSPMLFVFQCTEQYSAIFKTNIKCLNHTQFYRSHGHNFMKAYKILNLTYPLCSLIAMLVSTILIAYKLHSARSRRSHASNGLYSMSERDRRVMKMLTITIVFYIICITPRVVHFVAMIIFTDYYYLQKYNNIFWTLVYIIYFFDYLNALSHFPLFLTMGTNFRQQFRNIFCSCCECCLPNQQRADNDAQRSENLSENATEMTSL